MTDEQPIDRFRGEYRFLSNFWPAVVTLDGITYPTVEHAYQAAKILDPTSRGLFYSAATPGDAKRLGRQLTRLRGDWHQVRLAVMADLVRQKFTHPDLRDRLLATGNRDLIEGNDWGDTFWGVCRGVGDNQLGRILMKVREELRGESSR